MKEVSDAATVFIVDDDAAVRDSMTMLLDTVGLPSKSYSSADEFLAAYDHDSPGCLLLDIRMPGMSGIDLQEQLRARHAITPIIFITGHGDVPMAVEAIQGGAIDFLQKPFRDQELIDRITAAMKSDKEVRQELGKKRELQSRFESLTPREKDVLELIVQGHANKVVAYKLGVSQRTVEIHRARVMEKMRARSFAQLVRMSMALEQKVH